MSTYETRASDIVSQQWKMLLANMNGDRRAPIEIILGHALDHYQAMFGML
jgi:hypothetical protein